MTDLKQHAIRLAASTRLGIEEIRKRREPTAEEYRYASDAHDVARDHGATREEITAETDRQRDT